MSMQFFSSHALPAAPWKNGGGTTQEVLCWPAGAGIDSFSWRISIAQIASSGPFSAFAGVDRIITLLGGDGVHLQAVDRSVDHVLQHCLQPFAFSGDVALDCQLLGGASQDLNVMTRRGRVQAQVTIHRGGRVQLDSAQGLLLARAGNWRLPAHAAVLTAGGEDGLYWTAALGGPLLVEASSDDDLLIAVALQEVAPSV
jgi:environmental stress-induced protein Ves